MVVCSVQLTLRWSCRSDSCRLPDHAEYKRIIGRIRFGVCLYDYKRSALHGATIRRLGTIDGRSNSFGMISPTHSTLKVALERVNEYTQLKREPPEFIEPRPPTSWPSRGEIKCEDLVIRYAVGFNISSSTNPQLTYCPAWASERSSWAQLWHQSRWKGTPSSSSPRNSTNP